MGAPSGDRNTLPRCYGVKPHHKNSEVASLLRRSAGIVNARSKRSKIKCEAAMAVGALDPGVPYESRWAPCDRIHGPGQGQFPEGSIRPRGYMAPDARHSFAPPM